MRPARPSQTLSVVAIVACGVALAAVAFDFLQGARLERAHTEARIADILDDACDLLELDQDPGAGASYERRIKLGPSVEPAAAQRETLRRVKQKVDRALRIDPDNVIAQSFSQLVTETPKTPTLGAVPSRREGPLPKRFASAYCALGHAFLAQDRPDDAIESYRRAIEIAPPHPQAHVGLGNALLAKNKLPEAAAMYERAIAFDPRMPSAYPGLGIALHRQGRIEEALAQYTKALESQPDFAPASDDLADALFDLGRMNETVAQDRHTIEIAPKLASAYNGLGAALAAQGDVSGAVDACRKALELEPGWGVARTNLDATLRRSARR